MDLRLEGLKLFSWFTDVALMKKKLLPEQQ